MTDKSTAQSERDGSPRRSDSCQMKGCTRPASGRYTRDMYLPEEGETWPDDVCERPICWRHHWFMELSKAAVFGSITGLVIGLIWLATGVIG